MTVTEVSIINFATSLLIFTWFDNNCSLFSKREYYLRSIIISPPCLTLQKDKRYLILECVPEERNRLLNSYIDELFRTGPPPPPTASAPSNRSKMHWWRAQEYYCTMKTDFYSLWSKWYWPEFHHKTPLILLFSKYMKLFEIWFLSYGPWNSVLKSLLTGLWPFFLMLMRKDLTEIVFGHSAGIS